MYARVDSLAPDGGGIPPSSVGLVTHHPHTLMNTEMPDPAGVMSGSFDDDAWEDLLNYI